MTRDETDEADEAIREFLGDTPRAAEWRALREALSERLAALKATREAEAQAGSEPARLRTLDSQIAALRKQVATLQTEEVVSQFVEDSLMVTIAKSMPEEIGE